MKLFISYRHKDLGIAQQIAEQLRRRINGYVFFDERSIDKADFEKSILSHLRQSDVIVLIVTEHTFILERIKQNNDWIRREIGEALDREKHIVPVCINTSFPPTHPLPPDIQNITRMNSLPLHLGHRLFEASIQNLVDFINRISGAQGETILQKTKEALLRREYMSAKRELDKVLDLLDNYAEPQYIARGDFYRALIRLNGRRPRVLTLPAMREVEDFMRSTINQHKTAVYLLALGSFKRDFSSNLSHYEEEGIELLYEASRIPRTPEDDELLEILAACQPDIINTYLKRK